MRWLWLLGVLTLSCKGRGCAHELPRPGFLDDDPVPLEGPESAGDAEALAPIRCTGGDDAGAPASFTGELGNAVEVRGAPWVGAARSGDQGREAVVIEASSPVRVVPLGPLRGDDPPAVIAGRGEKLYAAWFSTEPAPRPKWGQAGRILRVAEVGGTIRPVFEVARSAGESLAMDLTVAHGSPTLAWDEDEQLRVTADGKDVVTLATGAEAVEGVRVVFAAERVFVLAVGRAFESSDPSHGKDPVSSWEGAGERRSHSWLLGAVLGPGGVVQTPPTALTSKSGHAEVFDLRAVGDGVQVVVRDATEAGRAAGEERGASLSALHWTGSGNPIAMPLTRIGSVMPVSLLESGWLLAADVDDTARLWPLGADARLAGLPSREPWLEGARLLHGGPGRLLFAQGGALRELVCR